MNRSELITAVARDTGVTRATAEKVTDSLERVIGLSLVCGEDVLLWNFGKFVVIQQEATARRNPRTGERVEVPSQRSVRFRSSPALKERLNGRQVG